MQTTQDISINPLHVTPGAAGQAVENTPAAIAASGDYRIIRRNGAVVAFEPSKIAVAVTKAFLAINGGQGAASARIRELVEQLTNNVVAALVRRQPSGGTFHIEDVQDQVELSLMRSGEHDVARAYVLYRAKHMEERRAQKEAQGVSGDIAAPQIHVTDNGVRRTLDMQQVRDLINAACVGLEKHVDADAILAETVKNLYDGVPVEELHKSAILAARALMEKDPAYSQVTARILLHTIRKEVFAKEVPQAKAAAHYIEYFPQYIAKGIDNELLDPVLATFDLAKLARALVADRDLQFGYIGLQTLYDRYFLHVRDVRIEMPQAFYMRVAMGLSLREENREARAIEFYNLLSSFDFMASTPTLFNSGTLRPQLSSCFLTTVADDLDGIFKSVKDNALLAKYSGGLGNDWTRVRGLGAHIKGTNGESQGVVPFLKVANDTAIAVNQGGKRKGAVCAYLETWHVDIEEFLDLRKNTGDDRRRTHDMNTANWVPDLFMQRVESDGEWTLFSPDEAPDLHDLYGKAFAERYAFYEEKAARGEMRVFKKLRATDLWRRMLTMLFETGHPWITFKDPCNLRSPQQHVGVIHSSNLCTEITLNTSDDEVAVCNLGSVNLLNHVGEGGIDHARLKRTISTAMRMLDNVIDINFYTIPEARRSNLQHRPVGLGLMGFQDALHALRIPMASDAAVTFADTSMEAISFHAITASVDLAAERGQYPSFKGSLWSRGILPIDSIEILADARGSLDVDWSVTLDWTSLRARVQSVGMRNSNVMAIAPTATISNICGVAQSIEPAYQNLYVKSNMSGDFTEVNEFLVRDLKARGLWDEVMVSDLKYFDGSVGSIDRVPDDLKLLYATAFEIDSAWLIEAAARRQKWIDQAQSLNLYIANPSGKKLDQLYRLAWTRGLKTTYYLRSRSATHVEKSTLKGTDGKLNAVSSSSLASMPVNKPIVVPQSSSAPDLSGAVACSIDNPDCEACQ
ncbi:MAG: ribonucleoside-diphosphate reductase subunit alpha [Afipia sp.]|nr:ribonucleoside-diphosphate reductase subunit alpha [Afipia sp.]